MKKIKVSELRYENIFRWADLGENSNFSFEFVSLEWDYEGNKGYNLTYIENGLMCVKYISAKDNLYNENINTNVFLIN